MPKPKLTPKQAKFVEGIAKGKKQYQAALDAYDTTDERVATAIATENLSKPSIRQALEPIFEKHNINIDSAIAPIGKALTATKVVIHGNKEDAFAEVVEDLDMQLKGSDRALKLMGIGQDKTGDTINNFGQMIVSKGDKYSE
jgi:phage terminase small subunit